VKKRGHARKNNKRNEGEKIYIPLGCITSGKEPCDGYDETSNLVGIQVSHEKGGRPSSVTDGEEPHKAWRFHKKGKKDVRGRIFVTSRRGPSLRYKSGERTPKIDAPRAGGGVEKLND